MKKILSCLFCFCISISLLCAAPILASSVPDQAQRVFDDAGLFSSTEIAELEEEIRNFQKETDMDFAVVTASDLGGESTQAYADNFYDDHGFGTGSDYSGALFLIDMENRLPHISTTGEAIRHLTDSRLERILDGCYDDLSDGSYADAALYVIRESLQYYLAGIPSDQYNYDTETGEISPYQEPFHLPSGRVILLFALIALAVGGVFCASVFGKYRMNMFQYEYPFRQKGKLFLREKEDIFLRKSVSKSRIQRDTSSGGGSRGGGSRSSTHTSRSGRTHGGRTGKRF